MKILKRIAALVAAAAAWCPATGKTVEVASPGGNLVVAIEIGERIDYSVRSNGRSVIEQGTLALRLADRTLGERPHLRRTRRLAADEWLNRIHPTKNARVHNRYNGIRLDFEGGYAVELGRYAAADIRLRDAGPTKETQR